MTNSDWTTLLWWAVGGVAALAGIALLLWALLGDCWRTRKARPRRCPKCWYDLSGTAALTCSECGYAAKVEAKLHRSRRRWRWAGVALLLFVAGVGFIRWQQASGYDWNQIKPVWWLKRQGYGNSPEAFDARTELIRRLSSGKLSQNQVTELADYALRLQADQSYPWHQTWNLPTWGDFVEIGWFAGQVDNDRLHRYLDTAYRHAIESAEARPIPSTILYDFVFTISRPRLGGLTDDGEIIGMAIIDSMTIDDSEVDLFGSSTFELYLTSRAPFEQNVNLFCSTTPGSFDARVQLDVSAAWHGLSGVPGGFTAATATGIPNWKMNITIPLTVIATEDDDEASAQASPQIDS